MKDMNKLILEDHPDGKALYKLTVEGKEPFKTSKGNLYVIPHCCSMSLGEHASSRGCWTISLETTSKNNDECRSCSNYIPAKHEVILHKEYIEDHVDLRETLCFNCNGSPADIDKLLNDNQPRKFPCIIVIVKVQRYVNNKSTFQPYITYVYLEDHMQNAPLIMQHVSNVIKLRG